jgi:hypothetical protein
MHSSNYPYDFGMKYAKLYGRYLSNAVSVENFKLIFKILINHRFDCSSVIRRQVFENISQIEEKLEYLNESDPDREELLSYYSSIRASHISSLFESMVSWNPTREGVMEFQKKLTPSETYLFDNICRIHAYLNGVFRKGSTNPRLDPAYYTWNGAVKLRDNFTCKRCGSKENLVSHHIMPVSEAPEFVSDVNNGICLCEKCHKAYHGRFRVKSANYQTLNYFINERRKA